jgi:hypothetical protein
MISAEKTKTHFTIEELINEQQEFFDAAPHSLRDQLIEAPATGEFMTLPENTVTMEIDSRMILEKDFPHEVFGYVAGFMQEHSDVFAETPVGKEDGPFQLRLQKEATTLGEVRQTMRDREANNESDENNGFKLNLLYSGEADAETPELSGVLVFGHPTPEQVETLRGKLPEGVPLLNGDTNELLDEVGLDQREKGQRAHALRGYLSAIALMGYFQTLKSEQPTYSYETYTSSSSETPYEDSYGDYYTPPFTENYTHHSHRFRAASSKARQQRAKTRQSRQNDKRNTDQGNNYNYQQPRSTYEENDEAKLYREAVTLMNQEAQKLNTASWVDLDRKGLSRIERRIARQLHSDQNENGNDELLKKVTSLIAQKRGPLETFSDSESTVDETAPTAQPEAPEAPQEASSEEMNDAPEEQTDDIKHTPTQPLAIESAPERKAITSTPHSES